MNSSDWEKELEKVAREIASENFSAALNAEDLESLRIRFLGRKAPLTELLKSIKDLSVEERRLLAPKAQQIKSRLESEIESRSVEIERLRFEADIKTHSLDLSLPPLFPLRGRFHPLTRMQNQMAHILGLMGFSWAEGPLIEDDEHNFTALNIPEHHSARDMQDTFYVTTHVTPTKVGVQNSELLDSGFRRNDEPEQLPFYIEGMRVLRTHTSPVQIRAMEEVMKKQKSPSSLRIICPGRVFRHEAVDATHSAVFHQVEGLYVDQNVTFADLKGTLEEFLKALFGPKIKVRFRPSYFPFTEPSAEVDLSCLFCSGTGMGPDGQPCGICKKTGFIEILGAGMVHPNVFKAVGYDPEIWSGFAFGIGVERIAMLKWQIKDIRNFYENDVRFLSQFEDAEMPLFA